MIKFLEGKHENCRVATVYYKERKKMKKESKLVHTSNKRFKPLKSFKPLKWSSLEISNIWYVFDVFIQNVLKMA
jgi:hypothetical protein